MVMYEMYFNIFYIKLWMSMNEKSCVNVSKIITFIMKDRSFLSLRNMIRLTTVGVNLMSYGFQFAKLFYDFVEYRI